MATVFTAFSCGSGQFMPRIHQTDTAVPREVKTPQLIKCLSAPYHNIYLNSSGHCYGWGLNNKSQISNDPNPNRDSSSSIQAGVVDFVVGTDFTAFSQKSGEISFSNRPPLDFLLPPYAKIWSSYDLFAAQTSKTTIDCQIDRTHFQIIIDAKDRVRKIVKTDSLVYILFENCVLKGYNRGNVVYDLNNVVDVAASRHKIVYILECGLIYEDIEGEGVQVFGIPDLPIAVFAGGAHYGCVTLNGHAYAWGNGLRGQLGIGKFVVSNIPQKVIMDDRKLIVHASAGEEHSIFLTTPEENFSPVVNPAMMRSPTSHAAITDFSMKHAMLPPSLDVKMSYI